MDQLNRDFSAWASTPVGSILISLILLIIRFSVSEYLRRRPAKSPKRRKPA